MDDAFKRLEELAAMPEKKKRVDKPLTPEQKARRAENERKRYAENPDKKLDAKRKYRAENREKILEYNRKWRAENPDKTLDAKRKYRAENPEKERGRYHKRLAENPEKERGRYHKRSEKKAADPELFAINQAARYACIGSVTRDITANCPEPTRSKLQALVDQIRADPSAGKQVVSLLCNMRELRKLELAEQQQATETETEN